jgi:hypothetical protein
MLNFLSNFLCRNTKTNDLKTKNNDIYIDNNIIDKNVFYYYEYSETETMNIVNKITKNISYIKNPTYDEIDEMLITANYLLEKDKIAYEDFILNCPDKFMSTYANNSERTPYIIEYVDKFNKNLAKTIEKYTDTSKKNTWKERLTQNINM